MKFTTTVFAIVSLAILPLGAFAEPIESRDIYGTFWCNKVKGGNCKLPGVGPTDDCGKKNGASVYESDDSKKFWRVMGDWEGFEKCCHNAGKGACHS